MRSSINWAAGFVALFFYMGSGALAQFGGLTVVTPPSVDPVSIVDARAHSRQGFSFDDSMFGGYIRSATQACENILRRALMPQSWQLSLQHWPGRDYTGTREFVSPEEYAKFNRIELPLPPLISITSFTYTDTQGNDFPMAQGYGKQVGNYTLDLSTEPGRIMLPFSGIWPTTILLPGSPIKIVYQCGYSAFSGAINVDGNTGVATAPSGTFDPRLAGTWVTITPSGANPSAAASYSVARWIDATHLQLVPPSNGAVFTTLTNAVYSGNAVPMSIRHAILLLAGHFYETRETIVVGRSVSIATEVPFTVDALLAPYRIYTY